MSDNRSQEDPPFFDLVERRIREAMAAGDFDDLPGAGRPIPDIDEEYQPDWWAKKWLERHRLHDAADELRRAVRGEVPRLRSSPDREGARRRAAELNALIDEVNAGLEETDRIQRIVL